MAPDRESSNAAPATEELEKVTADAYNLVVSAADLEDIRLVQSEFSVEPLYYAVDKDTLEFERTVEFQHFEFDNENNYFYIPLSFSVSATKDKEKLLSCSSTYVVLFSFEEKIDKTAAMAFSHRVGVNAAYPYFREYVAAQSWASGTDLPTLPLLKQEPRKPKPTSEPASET